MASKKLVSVEAMLNAIREDEWRKKKFTIFRVPAYVRESNRTAYEPRMVSIGPYYHGRHALRAMEDHKWRYLNDLLSHTHCPPDVTASTLLEEMRGLKAQALACYSERPVPPDDSDDDFFARMLLLDGCFILEFFSKCSEQKSTDALCDVDWGLTLIAADLLLLENQIPFFVLEKLYSVVTGAQLGREFLLNFLVERIGSEDKEKPIICPCGDWDIDHLLHLYYKCYVPKRPEKQAIMQRIIPCDTKLCDAGVTFVKQNATLARFMRTTQYSRPKKRTIPRATELLEAGVTFVRVKMAQETPEYRFDVTFDHRTGVIKIPVIEIDDMRRPLLVNVMAFEQTLGQKEPGLLTSYVALMSNLIVTARDVALLRRHRILESLLADDDEAARFFSRLGVGSAMDYELQAFAGLYEDVHRYCDSPWHRYRAALHRDYFSNPWSVISVVVAAVLVVLTITQTYFAVYPSKN